MLLVGGSDLAVCVVNPMAWPADPAVWPLDPAARPQDTAVWPLDPLICGCGFGGFLLVLGGVWCRGGSAIVKVLCFGGLVFVWWLSL